MSEPRRPGLLTTRDVAEQAGVDQSTVRRWVGEYLLKPHHVTPGGHFRYTQDEVDRVLKTPKAAGEPPPK